MHLLFKMNIFLNSAEAMQLKNPFEKLGLAICNQLAMKHRVNKKCWIYIGATIHIVRWGEKLLYIYITHTDHICCQYEIILTSPNPNNFQVQSPYLNNTDFNLLLDL